MAEVVAQSSQLEARTFRLEGAEVLPWQRCTLSDRVLVVQEGAGHLYLAWGRETHRRDVAAGDVVLVPRLRWHQLVASPDRTLAGALVTASPALVEDRR